MDDYLRHLFAYVDPDRLQTFSCGHIIPKENLIALQVAKGLKGKDFDFTYEKRKTSEMIDMLGDWLGSLSSAIPDGLVVFFPSYPYLDQVISHWATKAINKAKNTWDRLHLKKDVFRESKSAGVDEVLNQYSQAIHSGRGGLLLSVMGGKLSEGINFSDALGRGIVVVGLPFPNIQSPQWKAKLEYIEQSVAKRTGKRNEGKAAAREFYENSCLRTVNQSIGRAIRHKDDYAAIVLLDRRYASERIEGKLPGWIRQGLSTRDENSDSCKAIQDIGDFFHTKRDMIDEKRR